MVLLGGGSQVGDGILLVDVGLVGNVELLGDAAELADGLEMGVARGWRFGHGARWLQS